jgi:hypothetical protein
VDPNDAADRFCDVITELSPGWEHWRGFPAPEEHELTHEKLEVAVQVMRPPPPLALRSRDVKNGYNSACLVTSCAWARVGLQYCTRAYTHVRFWFEQSLQSQLRRFAAQRQWRSAAAAQVVAGKLEEQERLVQEQTVVGE